MLKPFQEKLYIFITPADQDDKLLRDAVSIALVRLAQKGNLKAQQELVPLLRYMVDQWIELSPRLRKWKGYGDDVEDKIKKSISDFAKLNSSSAQLAKLHFKFAFSLMGFIEEFAAEEGYYMPFYNATKKFLLFVSKHGLQNEFEEDAQKLVEYEQGYGSDLPDIYHQNFTKPIRKN